MSRTKAGRDELMEKVAAVKEVIEEAMPKRFKVLATFEGENKFEMNIVCNRCCSRFRTTHWSERAFFVMDIISETHEHFGTLKHRNADKTASMDIMNFVTPLKRPDESAFMAKKKQKADRCEGFGRQCNINHTNSFNGKHYVVGSESAWARDCLGSTVNLSRVCDNCNRKLKTEAVKKKIQRLGRTENHKVSKFTPIKLFDAQAQVALKEAAKLRKQQSRKLNRLSSKCEEIRTSLLSLQKGKLSNYIQDVAVKFREDSGETLTGATLAVANDLLKNASAVSKYGFRHNEILKALSVLVFNRCQSSLILLNKNLPELFASPSLCQKIRTRYDMKLLQVPGINVMRDIKDHFKTARWLDESRIGPLGFCHDASRVRELVKPNTKLKALIGFCAKKHWEGSWQFFQEYEDMESIVNAFKTNKKAGYVTVGLTYALQHRIPEAVECIIPHDNTFTSEDMNDWLEALKQRWAEEQLPVVLFCSDFDAKGLNYLERLAAYEEGAVGLDVDDWYIFARYHEHQMPLNPMGDSRHGVKLGRAHILYIDKFLPSACGVVNLQDFEFARKDMQSGLTKRTVNPADRQDVDEALAMLSEKARRAVYAKSGNITTVVYSFISRTMFDIINLECCDLPITRKLFLCGLIERIVLGWRTWILKHPRYKLSANFISSQYTKFFIFQTQGYVNRVLIHKKHFPNFPFVTSKDGSNQCEQLFRALKQKHGVWTVKDVVDYIRIIAGECSLINGTKALLHAKRMPETLTDEKCDLPATDEVRKQFLSGRKMGNKVLELIGMRKLLEEEECWDNPICPQWKTLKARKLSCDGTTNENDYDTSDEEEDEQGAFGEERSNLETVAQESDYFAKEIEKLAEMASNLENTEDDHILINEPYEEDLFAATLTGDPVTANIETDSSDDEQDTSTYCKSISKEQIGTTKTADFQLLMNRVNEFKQRHEIPPLPLRDEALQFANHNVNGAEDLAKEIEILNWLLSPPWEGKLSNAPGNWTISPMENVTEMA